MAAARALIRRFEGWQPAPYLCPAGVWSIGWGSVRDAAGGLVTAATPPIPPEVGEALLDRDLAAVGGAVARLVTVPLTAGERAALLSFTYNLGPLRLRASTLRRLLNAGDRAGAAEEFPKWTMAGGRRLPGLVRRRAAERQVFLGEAPPAAPPAPAPAGPLAAFLGGFAAGQAGRWPSAG